MGIIKSIFAENYASFADRIEFTCESVNNQKKHEQNTFISGDTELNLVSLIYGANGSGKSYFCSIIQSIQKALFYSFIAGTPNQDFSKYQQVPSIKLQPKGFAFDTSYKEKATTLGLELIIDGIQYHYEFSIYNNEVISEILRKKRRRTETILSRTSPDYKSIEVKSEFKQFDSIKHIVRNDALCLATASNCNISLARDIINSINQIIILKMATPHLDPPDMDLFSDEKMRQYVKILRNADPTIAKMNATFSEHTRPNTSENLEDREFIQKYIKVGINSEHYLYKKGKKTNKTTSDIEFFNEESLGTVKLFTALPYLLDVIEHGGILIVDEIENGLHLNLAKDIINLFLSKKHNPFNAQLICTSHQPLLLDGTNTKRDQVWIMHKDSSGKCYLDRLSNDPSTRLQSSLSNKLINGAMGCNPDPFFDN